MSIYMLSEDLVFPNPVLSDDSGILAVGGDLSSDRLLLAYSNGIFPWYEEGEPILWWSPDPRLILLPNNVRISKSLRKFMRKNLYEVTFDKSFHEVMSMCGKLREGNTWISMDMLNSYTKLHLEGFAHSVEVWFQGNLVGGLYGISLGKCFFGESMFSIMDNASKIALVELCNVLNHNGFHFIDCQVKSDHLESLGAICVSRLEFLDMLYKGISYPSYIGTWDCNYSWQEK